MRSSPHPEEYTLHPGEVWISCKTETIVDGTRWTDVIPRLAVPVRPGSWTEIEKRQKARELRQARPLRVWSALGDVLGRRGAEATPVVIGRLPDAHGDTAAPVVGRASMHEVKRTMVTLTPSGYVKYFESRGVELSLYKRDGRLKAQSRVQLSESDDALLHRVEPLIVGPE